MNPLVPVAALGAAALFFLSKKSSATEPGGSTVPPGYVPPEQSPLIPATPPPAGVTKVPVTINGHPWLLVPITGQGIATVDVYAPAGSWGPHEELRVCRFTQASSESARVLAGVAEDVPKAVLDAALVDLQIQLPAGPAAPPPPSPMAPPEPAMPASLQKEIASVMRALGVDASGVVRGPVTAAGIRHATELSSRLDQAGYHEAAATLRNYAQQAAQLLPPEPSKPAVIPPIPGVPPELQAAIERALELERDPAKLEALRAALEVLPASAERDLLIGALDALILQIRIAQANAQTATEIDSILHPSLGSRLLKYTSPNMSGDDVRSWQAFLVGSGFPVDVDGYYGPGTRDATKRWQAAHGLSADGMVGPETVAVARGQDSGQSTPQPPPLSLPTGTIGSRLLKFTSPNMSGDDVRAWQAVLVASGYPVTVDGYYGPGTRDATADWQRKRGLPADGIVGPATVAALGTLPAAPLSVPASPSPQPDPKPKTALTVAAEALAAHLLALQKNHGVKGSKGRQDMTLVKRFQSEAGGVADGYPGVGTLVAMAKAGVGTLPAVMYWPKNSTLSAALSDYRAALGAVASAARAAGYATLAAQIEASAARETGAGL